MTFRGRLDEEAGSHDLDREIREQHDHADQGDQTPQQRTVEAVPQKLGLSEVSVPDPEPSRAGSDPPPGHEREGECAEDVEGRCSHRIRPTRCPEEGEGAEDFRAHDEEQKDEPEVPAVGHVAL